MQAIKIKGKFPLTLPSNMLLYPKDKNLRNGSLGQANGPGVQDSAWTEMAEGFIEECMATLHDISLRKQEMDIKNT